MVFLDENKIYMCACKNQSLVFKIKSRKKKWNTRLKKQVDRTCPCASYHVRFCFPALSVEGKNGSRCVEQKCVSQRFRESAHCTSRVARVKWRQGGGGVCVCVYACVMIETDCLVYDIYGRLLWPLPLLGAWRCSADGPGPWGLASAVALVTSAAWRLVLAGVSLAPGAPSSGAGVWSGRRWGGSSRTGWITGRGEERTKRNSWCCVCACVRRQWYDVPISHSPHSTLHMLMQKPLKHTATHELIELCKTKQKVELREEKM